MGVRTPNAGVGAFGRSDALLPLIPSTPFSHKGRRGRLVTLVRKKPSLRGIVEIIGDPTMRAASSPSRIAHGSLVRGSMGPEAAAAGGGAALAVGTGAVGAADDAGAGAGAPVAGASRSNACFAAHNILFRFWSFSALPASQRCAFAAKSRGYSPQRRSVRRGKLSIVSLYVHRVVRFQGSLRSRRLSGASLPRSHR